MVDPTPPARHGSLIGRHRSRVMQAIDVVGPPDFTSEACAALQHMRRFEAIVIGKLLICTWVLDEIEGFLRLGFV